MAVRAFSSLDGIHIQQIREDVKRLCRLIAAQLSGTTALMKRLAWTGSGEARSTSRMSLPMRHLCLTARGVPTLREYFRFIKDKDVFTNIELKTGIVRYEDIEEKTMALVDGFGLREKVLFPSFNHRSLRCIKNIAPQMSCACLVMCHLDRAGAYARERGYQWINPHFTFINEETVAEMNAEGIGAQVWTVDDANMMRRLMELEVYAVITNRPDKALAVRREVLGI